MNIKQKLAIVSTHPIQYNAPLFEMLTARGNIIIKVFYTWGESVLQSKYDPGFAKNIEWDIPLLHGYDFCFVRNIATDAGSHHFRGIDNPSLVSEIRNWKADAVLVYGWSFKSHLNAMRYFHGKTPVFFRGDSTLLDEQVGLKSVIKTVFLKWVYHYVDKALYVGKNNKAYYVKYGLKKEQLLWAPHAIDNSRFRFSPDKKKMADAMKAQLGIPANELIFLFAGKFEEKKNPELLLQVFSETGFTNCHLLMIGNGPLETTLKSDFQKNANIHFIDFQNQGNMPAIYQLADIFVLPSKGPGETWGLALNEAMAAGKPVLASDKCGAAADIVANGENGFIFKSNDANDLRQKIEWFLSNKQHLESMGQKSSGIIENWNYKNVCIVLEQMLIS